MTIELNEPEHTLLCQLLNLKLVEDLKKGIDTNGSLESALLVRLLKEREAFIVSQRSKGLPVG